MRKLLLRLAVTAIAFMVGVGSSGGINKLSALVNAKAHTVRTLLSPAPRFAPTRRVGRQGYMQEYFTNDSRRVNEGIACFQTPEEAIAEFHETVGRWTQIVERIPKHRNSRGEIGERVVARSVVGQTEQVSIMWYDGGDSFSFIQAPTVELALEFERFLNGE
ncbi:MAG: hypothetical protein ABIO91_01940 [Pyrinomonadaceae bacterium]